MRYALSLYLLYFLSILFSFFFFSFFFFNDTATTEIYTLSLHDALPISAGEAADGAVADHPRFCIASDTETWMVDRKSTRLNSSHTVISYAVFCLKKKKKKKITKIKKNKEEEMMMSNREYKVV